MPRCEQEGVASQPGADSSATLVTALLEEAERAEKAGRREIARRRYEGALYLMRDTTSGLATSIIRSVARTYVEDGQMDAAMDCLHAAHAIAQLNGDVSGIAQAVNSLAGVNLQRGDLDQAERLYREAITALGEADEPRLRAMVGHNLGVIANTRGDLELALTHYEASLNAYRAVGMYQFVPRLLNNMGMVYAHLERWADADRAYAEALSQADVQGDAPTALMVRVNMTDMWLARGQVTRAAGYCAEVTAEASALGDHRALGEAAKHRGIISRRQGRLADSERHLAAAYASAMQREDLLLAAEAAREQAELYELEGRSRETLQALVLSHGLFTRLRAQRELLGLQRNVVRLETRFYTVVRTWAETIESKDPYTMGHCDRVAELACALAREIGLDEITMFWFRMGALLHDVGKIVVPTEVLNKNGPLTVEERELIERHPEAGVDLLRDIEFPWDILPMIRGHHERWDGTGYPDRLAGEAIPQSARILCVADVYDALTTDRPYRAGFSPARALEIMMADSGRLFDPAILDAFVRMLDRRQARQSLPAARLGAPAAQLA